MGTLTKAKRRFFMLMALAVFPATSSAINYNPTSVKGIAQAYGFILGQEYSLSRVEKGLPELAIGVVLARSRFGGTFPDIKNKLESQLKKAMGEKSFQATATNLRTKLRETLGRQKISSDIAVNFLEQVKARSKGEIESPVLEYLLAVKYTDTGLYMAVKNKHTDIAKFLAEEGALVNARNGDGKSPIDLAKESGQAELAVFFQQFSVA